MMRLAALLAALARPAACDLDYSRLHIVDVFHPMHDGPVNLLVRSNQPNNASGFDIEALQRDIAKRAQELPGLHVGYPLYIQDVSLDNDLNKGFAQEKAFWEEPGSKQYGSFTNWPLGTAGVLPPSAYDVAKRRELLKTTVWAVDKLPSRIDKLHQMMVRPSPLPGRSTATLVHCTAGCDRTGEVIGAYRMAYGGLAADGSFLSRATTTQMYGLDTSECGRSPNYWSTSALEWWCFECLYNRNITAGNCTQFASCQPLKHGQPCQPCTPNATTTCKV